VTIATPISPDGSVGGQPDAFYENLVMRATTSDEILSDTFEALAGQKRDADLAGRRLAAWCQSCASGDWSLFGRRLARDGLTFEQVLSRFATVRRRPAAPPPAWTRDAIWIAAAFEASHRRDVTAELAEAEPRAFEGLFSPVVEDAEARLFAGIDARSASNLAESARACLRAALLRQLSDLAAPALYARFVKARSAGETASDAERPQQAPGVTHYNQFVADMRAGGFKSLFEEKPVLLRLMATMTRQWIDTSQEFINRLASDLPDIRRQILKQDGTAPVIGIEGDLSDRHNGGHSVQMISFADGARVVYKPKDLRLDAAWHALVDRLNRSGSPIDLRAVRALPREGYGWTECIDHTGCANAEDCSRFFRRAGAWLALFHCFSATDMHQENIIAAADHPVPIDLEMILQGSEQHRAQAPEAEAAKAAAQMIANSVMAVGLLPAYGRSPDNNVFAVGGLTEGWDFKNRIVWRNVNTDAMRPATAKEGGHSNPNLPYVNGNYAKLADHIDALVAGFEDYARFLVRQKSGEDLGGLLDGFSGLAVRKVIHPTRFYHMLMQRLRNHQTMDDGVTWSAQADFLARLANWETSDDPLWHLQRSERSSLLTLNVPHFVTPADGTAIGPAAGIAVDTDSMSGINVARARIEALDEREIAWQVEVIRENLNAIAKPSVPIATDVVAPLSPAAPAPEVFRAEADGIADELRRYAIRRGPGAAWIGLDWLGDAEVFQLVCLGPDLYNGTAGIALFLAAHAATTGHSASAKLAVAAVADVRRNLKSRNVGRIARSFGIGGAVGLGSIVYALAVMSKCLRDDGLLQDAHGAVALFTDELIAADKQLDVVGGSAGAVLCLLRLYRDTQSADVLARAVKCGEHLLGQPRLGEAGRRSWIGQGFGTKALNGMSHGAAGFAYALGSLAAVTGRQDFAAAAAECIAFEDSNYDAEQGNWPDFRAGDRPAWPCQWCHGAPGIGLARVGTAMRGGGDPELLRQSVRNAAEGASRWAPNRLDTLCCGALGGVEFFCAAAETLDRPDLRELAAQRLLTIVRRAAASGDYAWNSGKRRFNLGLFRGLAGVGYTLLRQIDSSLPNALIWQ
jgi:type 2 lantibiotic biosynthesis protein LanM